MANREVFVNQLKAALNKAQRREEMLAVLFIDLDHFKQINDTLGHAIGDQLLISVGERLKSAVRDIDMVARLGGDEFAILLEHMSCVNDIAHIAKKLLADLQPIHQCSQHAITANSSIGIATYPACGEDDEALLRAADVAMYAAKTKEGNNFQFYSQSMQQQVSKRLKIESALFNALAQHELSLQYQPLIDSKTKRPIAIEALLRWHNPELGNISPSHFIPIATDNGQIAAIDDWVLTAACQQQASWLNNQTINQAMQINVNVSLPELRNSNFVSNLSQLLTNTSLQPNQLVIELNEAIIFEHDQQFKTILTDLSALGVILAIDDFGGKSICLNDLRELPIDILKIDPIFISDIGNKRTADAMVKSIIDMAHNLGFKVIAEGVETQQQSDFLISNQCDILQGYFFSRPKSGQQISEYLSQYQHQ